MRDTDPASPRAAEPQATPAPQTTPPAVRLAAFDGAEVDELGTLRVWGDVAPGGAVRLGVRRYKAPPAWAAVEVIGVDAPGASAPGVRFELSCSASGLWGDDGIEVVGADRTVRIARG